MMKKTLYAVGGSIIFLVFYVMALNAFASYVIIGNENEASSQLTRAGGSVVEIGVGNRVDVSVVRNRWYGKIYEKQYDRNMIGYSYPLELFQIPMSINGFDLIYIHLSIIIIVIFVCGLFAFIDIIERRYKRE